jgi:hypothetical protein
LNGTIKAEFVTALNKSVQELQQGIDMHTCLIASMLGKDVDQRNLKTLMDGCPWKSREAHLKDAIKEAIDVLDESRKAFRSKQLEFLRKKLTQVLIGSK